MADLTWVLFDGDGKELSTSEGFSSKEDAEAWMGANWEELLEAGGEYVSLRDGEEQVYRMGLRET